MTGDIIIPLDGVTFKALSSRAKILYGVIVTRSLTDGFCSNTDQELGEEIRVTPRTAKKHLCVLEERGLITQEKTPEGRHLCPNEEALKSARKFAKERGFKP